MMRAKSTLKQRIQMLLAPLQRIPKGISIIVWICIVAHIMQFIVAKSPVRTALLTTDSDYLLVPDIFTFLFAIHGAGLSLGFFWTPITYMFLHGSIGHLFLNLMGLLTFGSALEHVCGQRKMLSVFILSGIAGGVGWALANGLSSVQPCVGASAGVLGLVGAFAVLRPRDSFTVFIPFPINMPAWLLATLIFAINGIELFYSFTHVAYLAHLGGIAFGALFGLVLKHSLHSSVKGLRC